MKRWYQLALKIAHKSPHEKHRMAAIIIRGGSVLAREYNSASTVWGSEKYSKHAEERAISPHSDYTGATIYIARTNGGCSKPCADCQEMIRKAGINKMVYMNMTGILTEERV